VAWVTAANDFGVYDLRHADRGSNVRSKGVDGFTPLGPRLLDARAVDPAGLRLRSWVNGELAQDASVGDELLFGFDEIIADVSRLMTLEPGDVILTGTPTGTPTGSSVVEPGDVVEVEVTASDATTGRLRSPVVAADYRLDPPGAMPMATEAERHDRGHPRLARPGARRRRDRDRRRHQGQRPARGNGSASAPSAASPSPSSRAARAARDDRGGSARRQRRDVHP